VKHARPFSYVTITELCSCLEELEQRGTHSIQGSLVSIDLTCVHVNRLVAMQKHFPVSLEQ